MPTRKTGKAEGTETLLVELLTEELPPKALKRLGEEFARKALEGLASSHLIDSGAGAESFSTPRRLAVRIANVRDRAPDSAREVQGPSSGAPAQAVEGFARKCGVPVTALRKQGTPKGEVYVAHVTTKGQALAEILAGRVEAALKALQIPKTMRWGTGDVQFARPVHGLVMLHGSRMMPGSVLGVESSNTTRGHRFLSAGAIALKHADDYEKTLRERGKVIASFAARRALIIKGLEAAAGPEAALVADDALVDEITALVESPAVYAGEFGSEYLEVPEECLVFSMQRHQKYVPLRDKRTGKLLPRFLFVSNLETQQPKEIIHGNERVLRARLADARFFYDQDRKTSLEARLPRLSGVVYHGKLGSQRERVERIRQTAVKIAEWLRADARLTGRAALLAKADLLTEMVGEFPELQGTMGRYYALNDGEPREIADAIEAHYRPRFAGDILPEGPVGMAVALADKLDALSGLFGIGQAPTGERDPFGLRRAALGVIRILIERDLPLSVHDLIDQSFAAYNGTIGSANTDLEGFIRDRLSGYLRDRGYSALEVDSVLSAEHYRITDTVRQLEAVRAFTKLPEAQSLVAANKRVVNILKQAVAKGESFASVDPDRFTEPAERELYSALAITEINTKGLYKRGDFTEVLKSFAAVKGPVDAFFDSVMVMVEDRELRQNRLALLQKLRDEMNRVADLSKLAA